jgi:hypothetical protein
VSSAQSRIVAKQHEDKLRGSQDLQRSMANLSVSNNVSRKTLLNVKNPVSACSDFRGLLHTDFS